MQTKEWGMGVVSHLKQGQVPVVEVVIIDSMSVVDVHARDFGISLTWRQQTTTDQPKGFYLIHTSQSCEFGCWNPPFVEGYFPIRCDY